MASNRTPPETIQKAVDAVARYGSIRAAAKATDLPRQTLQCHIRLAEAGGYRPSNTKPFEVSELPDGEETVEELLARRKKGYDRRHLAKNARKLINVRIATDGPIGIAHFGDPHVDDDGCDIGQLERDVAIVNKTDGLFGANLGDLQNNWVGRLAALYGQQGTSAREAWRLTEWLARSVSWLYLVGGNHDAWSGEGDPLKWIMADQAGVFQAWGVRLKLLFPNGKEIRINARHDFVGHSMWNPAHGPMKAVQGGWRDHVLTCGHKHTSFIGGPLKCPATGILSWAIRCAGYKIDDRYAEEKGLPDQNAFPSCVTIINPEHADDDPRLITVIPSVEEGADFLRFKRRKLK